MQKKVLLKIYGRVQGVGFRFWVLAKAQSLNLTGWVRNSEDRGVEVIAEGEEGKLKDFLGWVRQGPPGAKIEKIEEGWSATKGEFKSFELRW